jgi:DNA-binding transcriptional ArsR family regulator
MSARLRSTRSRVEEIDLVCRAIADPTRREILDLLAKAPRTTGEIAERFPTTRFATMKHLSVLVRAGLVIATRRGRERWNHLNVVPLVRLHERWVAPLAERGAKALIDLDNHLRQESSR